MNKEIVKKIKIKNNCIYFFLSFIEYYSLKYYEYELPL